MGILPIVILTLFFRTSNYILGRRLVGCLAQILIGTFLSNLISLTKGIIRQGHDLRSPLMCHTFLYVFVSVLRNCLSRCARQFFRTLQVLAAFLQAWRLISKCYFKEKFMENNRMLQSPHVMKHTTWPQPSENDATLHFCINVFGDIVIKGRFKSWKWNQGLYC